MTIDRSTLNVAALRKLPPYDVSNTLCHISDAMGSACFGDAPGFPSFFIQQIYTRSGNNPVHGPQAVIFHPDTGYRVVEHDNTPYEGRHERLMSLWQPSAVSEARWEAWFRDTYGHAGGCWYFPHAKSYATDQTRLTETTVCGSRDKPGGWCDAFRLKTFKDDPRFSDEWRRTEQESIALHNRDTIASWQAMTADLNNHLAVRRIQHFLPDHSPRLDLIEDQPRLSGHWYSIYAGRPTPENCPGEERWGGSKQPKHPVNGSWCQVCGHSTEEKQ